MNAGRERFVLYLHGRGSEPDSPPGDLVASAGWRHPLATPPLTDEWLSLPFSDLVAQVDRWLDASALAVGHSFGAWLLLCAAVERTGRVPTMCLLAPILGKGFGARSGMGYFVPRSSRVRAALGLEGRSLVGALTRCVRFVCAQEDDQTSLEDARTLQSLGYHVTVLPGGHRLEDRRARAELARTLRDFAEEP